MDAPAPQPWGLGLRTRMKAPPASFVIFFPARDHPAFPVGDGTTAQLIAAEAQPNISWTNHLNAPKPISRLPAWHRVPVEAFPGKNGADSTRIIMKRIFQPDHRFAKKSALQAECKELSAAKAAAKEAAQWTMLDQLELPDAKARKLDSFAASDALHEFSGAPKSAAEMAQIYLTAKVDIVNGLVQIPRALLREEVFALRSLKRNRGVAPMKRRIDQHNCIENDGLYGGYRIETYDLLLPLILKAAENDGMPMDVTTASFAEISHTFASNGRRNPRRRISLHGIPELPDIIDRPELKNEVSLVLPSADSASDAKSPVKRSPQPVQPLKETPRRLSDTVVKLVPAMSPSIEPSPVKSPATPSPRGSTTPNPLRSSPSQEMQSVTPGPVSTSNVTSPSKAGSSGTPGPTLTFKPPSYHDCSSTEIDQSMADSTSCKTPLRQSPTKFCNPLNTSSPSKMTPSVAPGPTFTFQPPSYDDCSSTQIDQSMVDSFACKTVQAESPTKPFSPLTTSSAMNRHFSPNVSDNVSDKASQNASDKVSDKVSASISALGLLASIPAAATPKQQLPSFRPEWPSATSQIDFGPITPSFDSPSNWFSSDNTTRRKNPTKKSSRRISEPLIRNRFKGQAARRQTMSPSRLVFQSDVVFEESKPSTRPQTAEVEHTCCLNDDDPKSEHVGLVRTPEQTASPEPNLSITTPAISWGRMTGRVSDDAVTPLRKWTAPPKGVHNVDMRQHQDIFGASVISPARTSSAVDILAGIAQDRCDGQANVMVTEENGRLIVRFKLPTEFAHLFPKNQGEDESHFTITPSAISSSPRINFSGHELNDAALNGPPDEEEEHSSVIADFEEDDHTLVVSDFSASSPVAAPESEDTASSLSLSQLLQTPPVSHFSMATPTLLQPKPATPLTQAESATADKVEAQVSSRTSSPVLPFSGASVHQSSSPLHSLSPNVGVNHDSSKATVDQGSASQEQMALGPKVFDDSPGRDYMRDFIKRTSRKRLSTTETGSPIAPPLKRMPLGAKSSNTPSPQKSKRKAESDCSNDDADRSKLAPEPAPKRARQSDKLPAHESSAGIETQEHANKGHTGKVSLNSDAAAHAADAVDDQEDRAEMTTGNGPRTRRSTRLRSQTPTAGVASKSSIPTAIKLGSRSISERVGLNSTTRTEQQDLSHQTRINTRKNKGNAEHPSQVLARCQEERVSQESSDSGPVGKPSTGGKNVGWKTPLEAHQEEKPKKARTTSTYKIKASGIAKPAKPATAAQKQQRTAKVAATLGMSQNGTPAKPTRVTRSSTRVRRA
ncbi:hypothetical protein E4U43_002357 [Claviceps pusilla]|uniref:Uncharacterized protein n=1 Tax=Claviceps pusilla TaxID=123648 RepID=A0A9P7N6F4_9HYPO|nr:hypothetical protein E4U43_002357 [Claviceps pusilla]